MSALSSAKIKSRKPVLIYDRRGMLASVLAPKISDDFLPIIISEIDIKQEDAIVIKLKASIPRIPDNNFYQFFIVDDETTQAEKVLGTLQKEAAKRNICLIYITSIYSNYKKRLYYLLKSFDKTYCFLYGDLIDQFDKGDTPANRALYDAVSMNQVLIPGDGTGLVYPTTIQDTINFILVVLYKDELPSGIYSNLEYTKKTYLSFAKDIIQINPDIKLKTNIANTKKKNIYIPANTKYPITKISSSYKSKLKEIVLKDHKGLLPRKRNESNPSEFLRYLKYLTLSLVGVVIFLILFFLFTLGAGLMFLGISAQDFEKQDQGKNFDTSIGLSKSLLILSNAQLDYYSPIFTLVGLRGDNLRNYIDQRQRIALVLIDLRQALVIYNKVFVKKEEVKKEQFEDATYKIKNSLVEIESLRSEDKDFYSRTKFIDEYKDLIDLFVLTAESLPEILGYNGSKKYVVVFQNNNELRPGGGFIGSYTVVGVKNGISSEPIVKDVYEADGKLKGNIEPPFFMKRYMGLTNWFLRDSNTEVDNELNAENIAKFLQLETGEEVDGVIMVDLGLIKNILEKTGDIKIENYGNVNKNNFDKFSQNLIQENFFPGSTLKSDYLNDFYSHLISKIYESPNATGLILGSISKSLNEKSITIAFKENPIQDPIALLGFSSKPFLIEEENTLSNFLGVNESNLSGNKVNRFIKRTVRQEVVLNEEGLVKNNVVLKINNKSTKEDKYQGKYKAYIRFIIPKSSIVTRLSVNGQNRIILAPLGDAGEYEERGDVAGNTLEVERQDLGSVSTYGFFQEVAIGSDLEVAVEYDLSDRFYLTSPQINLISKIFKQPGTEKDEYTFVVRYPKDFKVKELTGELKETAGGLVGVLGLSEDKVFWIKLEK